MLEERSTAETSPAAAMTAADDSDDVCSEEELLQGLRTALKHKTDRKKANILLSPKRRDELLEELFPKINNPEDGTAKELSEYDYAALRTGLHEVIQSDVKKKMALLQDQLSEYHSVLEDVIAFKSRCERLEQDKKDLVSLCRDVCQVRDDKIALLEKELAQLRNERCSSSSPSSSSSSSDWVSSIISGGSESGSEGQSHGHRPQQNHRHPHPAPALPSTPQMLPRMNNYFNESRRITFSPSSVQAKLNNLSNTIALNTAAIRPLPFPGSSLAPGHILAPPMLPNANQQGGLNGDLCPPSRGENKSAKRHRHS
eukprot:scaffold37744_cov151-Skeletonema_marinoi.AAC.9